MYYHRNQEDEDYPEMLVTYTWMVRETGRPNGYLEFLQLMDLCQRFADYCFHKSRRFMQDTRDDCITGVDGRVRRDGRFLNLKFPRETFVERFYFFIQTECKYAQQRGLI